jgi:hypothetical protein
MHLLEQNDVLKFADNPIHPSGNIHPAEDKAEGENDKPDKSFPFHSVVSVR